MRLEWLLVLVAAAVVWAARAEEAPAKVLRLEQTAFKSAEIRTEGGQWAFCHLLRGSLENEAVTAMTYASVKANDEVFKLNSDLSVQGRHEGQLDQTTGDFKITTVNPKTWLGFHITRVIEGKLGHGETTDSRLIYNSKNEQVCRVVLRHITDATLARSYIY